ncbi:MAG: DUF222 domain-containing protein [Antricoccus sp.]
MNEQDSALADLTGSPVGDALVVLDAAVTSLLGVLERDLAGVLPKVAAAVTVAVERAVNRGAIVQQRAALVARESRVELLTGSAGPASSLSVLLGVSRSDAQRRLDHADALLAQRNQVGQLVPARYEALAAAQDAGRLGDAQARLTLGTLRRLRIAEVAPERIEQAEAYLAEHAGQFAPSDLVRVCARLEDALNPDGFTEPDDLTERRAFLELKKRVRGGYLINGLLTDQVGAKLQTVLTGLAADRCGDLDGSGDSTCPNGASGSNSSNSSSGPSTSRSSAGKRAHDALGAAADRLLKSGDLPSRNGASTRVLVTVSLDNLLSGRGGGWTDHGDYLPVSVIRKLAADAGMIPVVLGGNGEVLDVGRERRFATAPITWALTARDGGCTFPGCDKPAADSQRHHAPRWHQHRATFTGSMTLACGFHNGHEEQLGWYAVLHDGIPYWIPPAYIDPQRKPIRHPRFLEPDIHARGG